MPECGGGGLMEFTCQLQQGQPLLTAGAGWGGEEEGEVPAKPEPEQSERFTHVPVFREGKLPKRVWMWQSSPRYVQPFLIARFPPLALPRQCYHLEAEGQHGWCGQKTGGRVVVVVVV